MKLQFLLGSLVWLAGIACAAKPDKYTTFRRSTPSLAPIELNDDSYNQITAAPRNYHLVLLLTAMDARYGCEMCRLLQPEWIALGKTWNKAKLGDETRVLFGTLDFARGRQSFMNLKLQTAPVILLFPPTNSEGSTDPIRYDFSGDKAIPVENLHDWIARHLPPGPKPSFTRPINYTRVAWYAITVLGVVTLLTATSSYLLPVLRNRNLWTGLSMLSILLFISGHMFNHIRKTPYVAGDGRGGISYIASGFQNQLGMESQIIAAIYGVLSLATIGLMMKTPRTVDPTSQRIGIIIWVTVLWFVYSFVISLFRAKNGSYPLGLPPF